MYYDFSQEFKGLFNTERPDPAKPYIEGYNLLEEIINTEMPESGIKPIDFVGLAFGAVHPENAPYLSALFLTNRGWKESKEGIMAPQYNELFTMVGGVAEIAPLWLRIKDGTAYDLVDKAAYPPTFADLGGIDGQKRMIGTYTLELV